MVLDDLKTGYIAILKDGSRAMVIKDYLENEDFLFDINNKEYRRLNLYNEDMTHELFSSLDIIEVENTYNPSGYFNNSVNDIIWTREGKENEVNWANVKVDTPIWVRNSGDQGWKPRHFAKYANGKVYAWFNGGTSFSTKECVNWDYAKKGKCNYETK